MKSLEQQVKDNEKLSEAINELNAKLSEQEKMYQLQLKSEIENFNSELTLESIGRNKLKMAGEDEVLVIINKPKTQD